MILFNIDLDNTIIYSYKHDIGEDKKCVEVYQGREISFITGETARLLASFPENVLLVPTTTRTVEQYHRINLGIPTPPYAIVCNGGVLLVDGEEWDSWYRDSLQCVHPARKTLELAKSMLESDPDVNFEVRDIRRLFVFTKSAKPQETAARLEKKLDKRLAGVFQNGNKVYVVPNAMNKGAAVRRLREKLGADFVIAAGDSEFDIPMLWCADCPIAPRQLLQLADLPENTRVMREREVFSEFVLEQALRYAYALRDK